MGSSGSRCAWGLFLEPHHSISFIKAFAKTAKADPPWQAAHAWRLSLNGCVLYDFRRGLMRRGPEIADQAIYLRALHV